MGLFGDGGLGGLYGDLFFGDAGQVNPSGSYSGVDALGGRFSDYLYNRLKTPVAESSQFAAGSREIQDAVRSSVGTSKQRLADRAKTTGRIGEGALDDFSTTLERSGDVMQADQLRALLLYLEEQRDAGVNEYLSLGARESTGAQSAQLRARQQQTQNALDFHHGNMDFVGGLFGG